MYTTGLPLEIDGERLSTVVMTTPFLMATNSVKPPMARKSGQNLHQPLRILAVIVTSAQCNIISSWTKPVHQLNTRVTNNSFSLRFNGNFSRWTWLSRYQNVSIVDFVGAKGDGGGGDSWSYKTCKAPVKLLPPTNQHPAWCPSCRPNNSVKALKGKESPMTGFTELLLIYVPRTNCPLLYQYSSSECSSSIQSTVTSYSLTPLPQQAHLISRPQFY